MSPVDVFFVLLLSFSESDASKIQNRLPRAVRSFGVQPRMCRKWKLLWVTNINIRQFFGGAAGAP